MRQLDVSPIEHQGETYISLRDPEGFVEEALLLSPFAFFVAAHLDGAHDVVDIQHSFAQQSGGQLLMSEDVRRVVEMLGSHGFLINDVYLEIRRQAEESFAGSDVRAAYLAGKSYPAEADELRAFLDSLFTGEGAPGEIPGAVGGQGDPVRCLVVPHIDFQRGAAAYALGYLELFRRGKPDTVIIFGVAHVAPPVPFTLTRKAFQTPFGELETDKDVLTQLEAACAWSPYEYEIVHRTEHSIEFQAVMLAYLYGPAVKIVPILCGSFADEAETPRAPFAEPIEKFLNVCHLIASDAARKVSVIAGADLAHVGKRFGDDIEIAPSIVSAIESRDREDLEHAVQGAPAAFHKSVMKDGNERRVCGLHCIYSALRTAAPKEAGKLLHYSYAPDPAGGIVSFADILFD
ncbi:MAG: AmmeMemoRadiSam system protein B [Candidatus Hydrogenedentes bacterium]|nr:AmmeMemoRadiSam system protein B [Candidatus Hydrogenedentota bacterium]